MKYATIFVFCTVLGVISAPAQLKLEDLSAKFTNGYTYGTNCGIAGTPPVLRKDIEVLIQDENVDAINNWLYSPSLVHNVYAAEALIRLNNQLIPISKGQKDKIREIKSLKTSIKSCNGCLHGDLTVEQALADFELK